MGLIAVISACSARAGEGVPAPDGATTAVFKRVTASVLEITVTEIMDAAPPERRRGGGDAQGCCRPRIDKRQSGYAGNGVIHVEADVRSEYTHVLILLDRDKRELFRETFNFLSDRVIIDIGNVSCGDAPHRVRLWCTQYRQCYKTKGARGECS